MNTFLNMNKTSLLKPITLDILYELEESEVILKVHATFSQESKKIYDIILINNFLVFSDGQHEGTDPIWFINIDFSVNFERIYSIQNSKQKVLKGFKLKNDYGEHLQIFISFESLAHLWINKLSVKLNQWGFHKTYKQVHTLGNGAFATVYQILRLDDGKRFAAKVFTKEKMKADQNKMKSFMNELQILRNIKQTNLLKIQGVFQSQENFYIITQNIEGRNLLELLLKRKNSFTLSEIKTLIKGILQGLAALQQNNIIHRDIKPENIMVSSDGGQVIIVDFGLAVYADDEDYVYYNCGTPGYISPQAITLQKGQKLTPKSDIFSAGVVLYLLLTGRYLFKGASKLLFENNKLMNFHLKRQEFRYLNSEIVDLMSKMLQKNPLLRPSAKQCLKHLSLINQQKKCEPKYMISPLTAQTYLNFQF